MLPGLGHQHPQPMRPCRAHDLYAYGPLATGKEYVAENFGSRREPGDSSRFLGKPKVAAWTIVAVLVLTTFIGFGTLRGRAYTSTHGAGIVNPAHDARCPDLRVPVLDRCAVQRPSEPGDRPDAP